MALAEISDVETSMMRELTPSEAPHVGALLDRAEGRIRTRIPDIDDRVSADAAGDKPGGLRATVIEITAESVARVLRNPGGYTQELEGNYQYSMNFRVASGLLDILDEEWARLGLGLRQLGTILPTMDGYAAARYRARPDLAFQYGWGGDYPGISEVWP